MQRVPPLTKSKRRDGNDDRRSPRRVTGGVDTHLDLNVAAAHDPIGGLLGVAEFTTTSSGHKELLHWLEGFGPVARGRPASDRGAVSGP